jgi:rhamnose transport system permease protein
VTETLQYQSPSKAQRYRAPFPYWHEVLLAVLLVGLLIWAGIIDPRFMRAHTQYELSRDLWITAILALPMTMIILTAGIDLSVGSTMALCAVVLGICYTRGMPIWLAVATSVLVGILAGLLNGIFVAWVKVHPLIVTLATYSAYRGIAEGISSGQSYSHFPRSFTFIGQGDMVLNIPMHFVGRLSSLNPWLKIDLGPGGWFFIVAAIASALFLAKTPQGRWVYATGFNPTAARFSGIPVKRLYLWLYGISGLAAAIASLVFCARNDSAKADVGTGAELDAITAVVLGGTSIFGGRGRILGTVLGLLLIHEAREFVSWHWNNDLLINIVIGGLLIAAVAINSLMTPKSRSH